MTWVFYSGYHGAMPETKTQKQNEKQQREARIAKALRDNLKRRKQAMRKQKK